MGKKADKKVEEVVVVATIDTRVLALIESGLDVKKIKATLTLEDFKTSDIDKACKEAGLTVARSSGFTYPDTLAYLSESPRTESEFYQKILDEGTKNEARWINDRNKIRVTYNSIFVRFDEKFTEVAATKELKDLVKEKAKS